MTTDRPNPAKTPSKRALASRERIANDLVLRLQARGVRARPFFRSLYDGYSTREVLVDGRHLLDLLHSETLPLD